MVSYRPDSMASRATARRWLVRPMNRIFPWALASSMASYSPEPSPGLGQTAGLWNWSRST